MTQFKITNLVSGTEIGVYEGKTKEEALDAMARDAGYADWAHSCAVAPVAEGELEVAEI